MWKLLTFKGHHKFWFSLRAVWKWFQNEKNITLKRKSSKMLYLFMLLLLSTKIEFSFNFVERRKGFFWVNFNFSLWSSICSLIYFVYLLWIMNLVFKLFGKFILHNPVVHTHFSHIDSICVNITLQFLSMDSSQS